MFMWTLYWIIIYFKKKGNQHTDMQTKQGNECLWGVIMNANEEMLAGYADPDANYPDASYPDADPNAT